MLTKITLLIVMLFPLFSSSSTVINAADERPLIPLFEKEKTTVNGDFNHLLTWIDEEFERFDKVTYIDVDWYELKEEHAPKGVRYTYNQSNTSYLDPDELIIDYQYENNSKLRLRFYEDELLAIEAISGEDEFKNPIKVNGNIEAETMDDFLSSIENVLLEGYIQMMELEFDYFLISTDGETMNYELWIFVDEDLLIKENVPRDVIIDEKEENLNLENIFRFVSNHAIDYYLAE